MTTIRTMSPEEPKFPATDQHPDAKRVQMCGWWIDYIGDEPTLEHVQATLAGNSAPAADPVEKLVQFLAENPDVEAMVAAARK